jgi:hypothetical protein
MTLDCLFRVGFMEEMRGALVTGAGHGTTAATEEIRHIVRSRRGRQENVLVEGVKGSGTNHFLHNNFLVSYIR